LKPYDYFKALTVDKNELDFHDEEVKKDYTPFIMNRYFSMIDVFLPMVSEINRYDIPKEAHYQFYMSLIPKRKQYFNYVKKEVDEKEQQTIRLVATYFQCGIDEAKYYITKILSKEELQEIVNIYKNGQNKMIEV
jgi:hypothetical protein